MNQPQESSAARSKPRLRQRPPLRRPQKTPPWRFARRTLQVLSMWMRLIMYRIIDRSVGGDEISRELIRAKRLRAELERLGGMFVKIGQLMSVRTDIYPWEV